MSDVPIKFRFPSHVSPDFVVRLHMEQRSNVPNSEDKTSGYRTPNFLDGDKTGSTGWFDFHLDDIARRGHDVEARVVLINPSHFLGRIEVGTPFSITEGQQLIARGEIIAVLALEENAKKFGESHS